MCFGVKWRRYEVTTDSTSFWFLQLFLLYISRSHKQKIYAHLEHVSMNLLYILGRPDTWTAWGS